MLNKKVLISLLLILVFLTGCLSSNEDPTNIELEVLRASLLEKQLTIDELRSTIDEYVDTTSTHLSEIEQLRQKLDTEISIRKRIASESNKLLKINTDSKHYYEIDEELVFMVNNYEDVENIYSLEKLYLYENGGLPRLLYTAENIAFDLNRASEYSIVVTNEALAFIHYDTTLIQEFPLNEHDSNAYLQLFEDQYIYTDKPEKSCSIIASINDGTKTQLNGIYTVDYSNLEEVSIDFYSFNSTDYYIDEVGEKVFYSILDDEEKIVLYEYNLRSGTEHILATNTNLPFKLYKKENRVYYYSEVIESEKSIILAE